jgi:hypothetical protein
MFWEHEDQPHVYTITWHSGALLVLLLAITQGVSFFVIGRILRNRKLSASSHANSSAVASKPPSCS